MTEDFDDLIEILEAIRQLVDHGGEAFDADRRQRWEIERARIFAGNLAERISRRVGEEDMWTELIGIRNVYAHYTPGAISDDRVWFDAADDIDRVLGHVRYASQSE